MKQFTEQEIAEATWAVGEFIMLKNDARIVHRHTYRQMSDAQIIEEFGGENKERLTAGMKLHRAGADA